MSANDPAVNTVLCLLYANAIIPTTPTPANTAVHADNTNIPAALSLIPLLVPVQVVDGTATDVGVAVVRAAEGGMPLYLSVDDFSGLFAEAVDKGLELLQ